MKFVVFGDVTPGSPLDMLKVKLTLGQAVKVQRGSRHNSCAVYLTALLIWGWVVKTTLRPLYPRE
jgi:hypothetical protein